MSEDDRKDILEGSIKCLKVIQEVVAKGAGK